jgi:hypothetical protein
MCSRLSLFIQHRFPIASLCYFYFTLAQIRVAVDSRRMFYCDRCTWFALWLAWLHYQNRRSGGAGCCRSDQIHAFGMTTLNSAVLGCAAPGISFVDVCSSIEKRFYTSRSVIASRRYQRGVPIFCLSVNSHLAVGRDAGVRLLSINRASGGKPHRSIRQESSLIINNAELSQKRRH